MENGHFPVELLGSENPGKIGMHANCGTHSLIVYLRERMKKATVAAKRRERWAGGNLLDEGGIEGKQAVERLRLNIGF